VQTNGQVDALRNPSVRLTMFAPDNAALEMAIPAVSALISFSDALMGLDLNK
jgi:hypothetical protein